MASTRRGSRMRVEDPSTPAKSPLADMASPGPITNTIFKGSRGGVDALRANREDERVELQELNKRLEMYILRQREKEAGDGGWKREFDLLLQKYERDIKKMKDLCESQLSSVRKVNEEQLDSMNTLKSENANLSSTLSNLTQDHDSLKQYSTELQQQNDGMAKDLSQVKAALLASTEEARNALRDLEKERLSNGTLRNEIAEAHRSSDEVKGQLSHAETTIMGLRDQLAIQESATSTELSMLRAQLEDAVMRGDSNMETVRKEYEEKMKRVFEDRHRAAVREKEDAVLAIKDEYDDKVLGYRASLEKMGHDLEVERNKSNAALNDLNVLFNENEELKAAIHNLQVKLSEQGDVVDRMRQGESELIAEKNEVIRKIKEAFKQKDREFDELMDTKIALAMELKVYESLLEAEEGRLEIVGDVDEEREYLSLPPPQQSGFFSRMFKSNKEEAVEPPRKRRREEDSTPATPVPALISNSAVKTTTTSTTTRSSRISHTKDSDAFGSSSSLLISGRDAHGQYVSVHNGSNNAVEMNGWSLETSAYGYQFQFPADAVLKAGENFTLRTGEQQGDWPNTAWVGSGVWAPKDECILRAPDGEVQARVEIVPPEGEAAAPKANDCTIM